MNTQREEKAKKIVKLILKEILILAICVGIAFLGKFICYYTFIQSNRPPLVSKEKQKTFNDNLQRTKQLYGAEAPIGLISMELGVGDYKYDNEVTNTFQLEDINSFRKHALESHAEDASTLCFWILLIGLPLLRYIIILIKWLSK